MPVEQGEMAVAILDILGFKALMAELLPAELYATTLGQLPDVLDRAGTLQRWPDTPVRSLAVSDTLFLWLSTGPGTELEGPRDAFACVEEMCLIVYYRMHATMHRRIPLRGAIAFGDCFASTEQPAALLGKPVFDAHDLEHDQEWAGAALCRSAEQQLGDLDAMYRPDLRKFVRYPVPLKKGRTEDRVVIKWPDAHFLPHPLETMRMPGPDLSPEERRRVDTKIANTAAFYERFKGRDPYIDKDGGLVVAEFLVLNNTSK
jgi:hypothetical protein